MKRIIEIEKLGFKYDGQTNLLSDFSIKLRTGYIYALLGKQGEGKSTLLKLISGLLFPDSGELRIMGQNPGKRHPKILQNIFFLPEEMNQSNLSVQTFEKVYAPFYPDFSSSKFYENMNIFLLNTSTKDISKLNNEQKKKFFLAFGLATNAKIILLDEPTDGLSPASRFQFKNIVTSTVSKSCCILISTHLAEDLEDIPNELIVLDNHKILLQENRKNITQKFLFKTSDTPCSDDTIVYSEQKERIVEEEAIPYYNYVCSNTGEAGSLDTGMFYNALMADKDQIKDRLKQD